MLTVESLTQGLTGAQSLVTVSAVAVGIWWFLERRERVRKANLSHQVTFLELGKGMVYIGVYVTIENIGRVIIRPITEKAQENVLVIEELTPYLGSKQESQQFSPEYKLKLLGARTFPKQMAIEPGETHATLFEFIIPKSVAAIKVYSYIDNGYNVSIGWSNTSIHEVKI